MAHSHPALLHAFSPAQRAEVMGRLLSRFLDDGECWLWSGATNGVGYGVLSYRNQKVYTHRLAYVACRGPIDDGLVLDHRCGRTLCFNPCHLDPVTQRINVIRAVRDARTHCRHGHQWTPETTYIVPSTGARICRTCSRAWQRSRRQQMAGV